MNRAAGLQRTSRLVRLWLPVALAATGCAMDSPPDESVAPEVILDDRRTTEPDVAIANLEARIDALRARLSDSDGDLRIRSELVDHLLARAAFLGRYDDFGEVDALTHAAVDAGRPQTLLLRATYLRAVHRFEEALEVLDEADSLGARWDRIESARIAIELALGADPLPLVERATALLAESDAFGHRALLAAALAEAGRYEEADRAYLDALDSYLDVSPFTLAHVSFTRAVMWSEMAGRPDIGAVLYRDALERLPRYVVANTHAAELEGDAEAIARLRPLASQVDNGDPEPVARLAQRLGSAEAAPLWEASRARYEALLRLHPEAFLDHGAEFFTAAGDLERGLALALENLELRQTPRAYLVAIRAARDLDRAVACDLVARSGPLRARHVVLNDVAQDLRCR